MSEDIRELKKRKQGHSSLQIKDGKLSTFDPHAVSESEPSALVKELRELWDAKQISAVPNEYAVQEIPLDPQAATDVLNARAQSGWHIVPGSVYAVQVSVLRCGPDRIETHVYGIFARTT